MKALSLIEGAIFAWTRTRFLVVLFAIMLVKTGIWHIPNLDSSIRIAQNPFILWEPRASEQYIFTSWLAPFLAWLIGATQDGLFLLFHLGFSLAFTTLVVWLAFTRLEEAQARASMIIFAAMPVSATAYFWIGNDSLTLLLMASALALRDRAVLAALVGVLLGLQHFEQSMFGFAALAVASFATPRFGGPVIYPWRSAVAVLGGVIAGKLALMLIFHVAGMQVTGRTGWFVTYLATMLGQFWFHGQYVVWTVLGAGWLVAIRYADRGRAAIPFFVCLLGLLPLLMVVNDQTRVLAIVTFPLVFAFWLAEPDFLSGLSRREVAALAVVWLIVPWAWVYEGIPTWSVLPYDLVYIANKAFGWFTVPDINVSGWPFGKR